MAKPQPKLPTETDRQFFRRNLPAVVLLMFWFLDSVVLSWFFSFTSAFDISGLLVYSSLGVVMSQVVLLALLLALFPASLLFRMVTVTTASVASCLSVLMGAVLFDCWFFDDLLKLDAFPIVLIGFAVPFLLARHFLSWRLDFDWIRSPDHSSLNVAGLMVATAVVALAVSIMSFGEESMLMIKLAVAAVCMGTSFVVFVPMTFLIFTTRRTWSWLITFTAVPFLFGFAIVSLIGVGLSWPFWMGIGFTTSISSLILSFGFGLVVLQSSGGRLSTSAIDGKMPESVRPIWRK